MIVPKPWMYTLEQEDHMRERVARKILKHKDKLDYSQQQIQRAEDTLNLIRKRKEKGSVQAPAQTEETTE